MIKFKRLRDNAIVPTRGSEKSAGYDLYACIDQPMEIEPGECIKIGTGWAIEPPEGTFCGVFARSGKATTKGICPANAVGVGDQDYRGEYIVALRNLSNTKTVVEPNERIAQLIVMPYITDNLVVVDELSKTDRSEGGFGSTDNNKC